MFPFIWMDQIQIFNFQTGAYYKGGLRLLITFSGAFQETFRTHVMFSETTAIDIALER